MVLGEERVRMTTASHIPPCRCCTLWHGWFSITDPQSQIPRVRNVLLP